MSVNIKSWVPKSIKRPLKEMLRRRQLQNAIEKIGKVPAGQVPSREQLSELVAGWGNEGYAANLEYLEAVAQFALKAQGAILECGSGATTILMGVLCGKRNVQVWTLEHADEWRGGWLE